MQAVFAPHRPAITRRAYERDWSEYLDWCADFELDPWSREALIGYCRHLRDSRRPVLSFASKRRYLHGVLAAFYDGPGGGPDRQFQDRLFALLGPRNAPGNHRIPLTIETLSKLLKACRSSLLGYRDTALLSVTYWGAFKRSEVCGLRMGDLEFNSESCCWVNADPRRQLIAAPEAALVCPVRALRRWIEAAGIEHGPLWRNFDRAKKGEGLTGTGMSAAMKRLLRAAGLPQVYSPEGLRNGRWVDQYYAGVSLFEIAAQSGVDLETVARVIRPEVL